MAWKGVGRSGIGDQTIIGEYEDWDGLSMNGRQWKNRLTQETRDLSGADYWHQRKALEPKLAEDIPTFVHGRANVSAFAEPVTKPKAAAKTKSAFDSIMLADRNYSRLCGLSEQLDVELDNGSIDLESWAAARKNIDLRLEKAWQRVCKERPELIDNEELQTYSLDTKAHTEHSRALTINASPLDYSVLPQDSLFNSLSDENIFKKCACLVLTVVKWLANIAATGKKILEEGLV